MAQKAPGKNYRKGISLIELTRRFPDDEAAEQWFVKTRWPDGVCCPECGSVNVQERKTRKPQPYRCRDCRKDFSVKTDTLMHASPLGYQTWLFAIYIMTTNLKGHSSMKLHRDLGITQKSAWHLAHRIRETWKNDPEFGGGMFGLFNDEDAMTGPVEVDETYIGGKERNKHESKKLKAGTGHVGKTAVIGMKDRSTNRITAEVARVDDEWGAKWDKPTLQSFVRENAAMGATLYTDDNPCYKGMVDFEHESVKHSAGEYVREQAHTNGVESFWAMLKRGFYGTYHKISFKHLQRYVNEFEGRHNDRPLDTEDQMRKIAEGLNGKRLKYEDLVA